MHELSTAELLSAYLDGELTPDEQARAENLLTGDAAARRLYDELRGMRSYLQGLPRQELPDDFSARVLRSAERGMLAAPAESAVATAAEDPPRPAWQERIRRPLAYVAIVLAASVMIAIFNPGAEQPGAPEQPVVMAPRAADPQATPPLDGIAAQPTSPSISSTREPAPEGEARRSGDAAPSIGKLGEAMKEADQPLAAKREAYGLPMGPLADRADRAELPGLQQADKSLLVVTCEITPSAAREDTFRRVLARNQISLDDGSGPQVEQQRIPAPANRLALADGEARQKALDETGLEIVYVEATPQQLEATLADIAAQSKEFLSVDVGAAEPRGVQNRWQEQYSRGQGGMLQQRYVTPAPAADAFAGAPASKPAPAAPSRPSVSQRDANQPQTEALAGQAAQGQTQSLGRARAYAMPAEGLDNQRSAPPVMLKQQVGGGEAAAEKKAQQPAEQQAQSAKNPAATTGYYSQNPETLRALFVLRVAEEQKGTSEPAARPAAEPSKPR
jgi:negative regulator of sigma E activity